MSAQITVTLSEDVMQRAELLAHRAGRPVADVLAETIELSLRPFGSSSEAEHSMSTWPDEEVLAAADSTMSPADDQRLSVLLDRQQADALTGGEHSELLALMLLYQEGLLRKAQALREAVQRGLREPLQP